MRTGLIILVGLAVVTLSVSGCGSSSTIETISAEEYFERGKTAFDNEDYLDAINDFTSLTIQYPGSSLADDAQFYLGEARFRRGEYLLAVYEYQSLRRNMPASPFVAQAQYNIGLSYYTLSPKSPLDQDYSVRAIDEFQNFLEYFPTHELVRDAEAKIIEMNNRLAKKDYDTGVLYMKMERYKAATFYFESVLEKHHDSEYAERAHVGKIEALMARKRFGEARVETEKFLAKYPESEFTSRVRSLEIEIDRSLGEQSAIDAASAGSIRG
jgi:outer membrane protein assembly factor BamD